MLFFHRLGKSHVPFPLVDCALEDFFGDSEGEQERMVRFVECQRLAIVYRDPFAHRKSLVIHLREMLIQIISELGAELDLEWNRGVDLVRFESLDYLLG